ncbi:HNH endonuclease signature motif containing protein [Mycobacterium sp. PSTR-4-N]|uniref:HNH endonuclease signature motif containing protein n=1 Tax=Mycobacterium sp. PSTR-4-N TaxID=2917745 RepID=UPI001F151A42|nr:HNH endonuclease signature motif containing protein [Mycobacterium sp. PSTR-4-N]MCG7595600.1 HNH endonuclease [Mycobacterium sp. PSTR-4-N]
MFDLARVVEADLVEVMTSSAAAAARAEAMKLAAIAELWRRRRRPERERWVCADWDAAAAEVGAALGISAGRASVQMDLAVAMRDRFPRLGALLADGQVSLDVVRAVVSRTALVLDPSTLRLLDHHFAEAVAGWGVLSQKKLEAAIDVWIQTYDPDAVRRVRQRSRDRSFTIGDRHDSSGITEVYGRLATPDAALLATRLAMTIASVCDHDPRTRDQKRADAVGAIAAGATALACRCGRPDCAAARIDDGRASSITVTVIADQASLDAQPDPELHGEAPPPTSTPRNTTPAEAAEPTQPTKPITTQPRRAALIVGPGGGIVPAPLLADLIAHGATVRVVGDPDGLATAGYRPSTALDRFVRTRDLTCRFPGCDRLATHADIDHTVPYPAGATHPANTKCLCRHHHLLKTFWDGWTEQQTPDGRLHLISPTGHTYTTTPLSALLFPSWNTRTEPPPTPTNTTQRPTPGRHLKMPTRHRSRTQNHTAYIRRERALNHRERTREHTETTPPQHNWSTYSTPPTGADPPPF